MKGLYMQTRLKGYDDYRIPREEIRLSVSSNLYFDGRRETTVWIHVKNEGSSVVHASQARLTPEETKQLIDELKAELKRQGSSK